MPEVELAMKLYKRRTAFLLLFAGLLVPAAMAQGTREDYQRAEKFLPGNLRHRMYVADVAPHWIAKTNRFWYRKASPKGVEFFLVDPAETTTKPAFDQARLATALSKETKREYKPTELPLTRSSFPRTARRFIFKSKALPGTAMSRRTNAKRRASRP
jgi:hypothetical protein